MTERDALKRASHDDLLRMTADVVAAYVSKNRLGATDVPQVIGRVYASLSGLGGRPVRVAGPPQKPAVPVKRSIMPDHIVCLEDGKKLKMLKRHIRTTYGLSPEEYRSKWGLPADYPMVAPNYAAQRSDFAKKIGLGRGKSRR